MSHDHSSHTEAPNPFATGFAGRCPRCGEGHLFAGFLKTSSRCESCGLDLAFADSGDGPAIFIMFIVGFVVVSLALIVNVLFNPPMWVHLLLWIPVTIGLSLALLRPFKGIMIALQYRNDAREGQQTDDDHAAE
ncbi:MAG: DUF983 domain-containing protein [Hyphomicrobiaceae bacterium]|nr:DUF983 domain-containing protein [Hyphomicrobiaceae bacterium]